MLFIHRECFNKKDKNLLFYFSLLSQLDNKFKIKLISGDASDIDRIIILSIYL